MPARYLFSSLLPPIIGDLFACLLTPLEGDDILIDLLRRVCAGGDGVTGVSGLHFGLDISDESRIGGLPIIGLLGLSWRLRLALRENGRIFSGELGEVVTGLEILICCGEWKISCCIVGSFVGDVVLIDFILRQDFREGCCLLFSDPCSKAIFALFK